MSFVNVMPIDIIQFLLPAVFSYLLKSILLVNITVTLWLLEYDHRAHSEKEAYNFHFSSRRESRVNWPRFSHPLSSVLLPSSHSQTSCACHLLLLLWGFSITPQAPNTFGLNLKLHSLTVGRPCGGQYHCWWENVCLCVSVHKLHKQSRKLGSSSKALQWWKRG